MHRIKTAFDLSGFPSGGVLFGGEPTKVDLLPINPDRRSPLAPIALPADSSYAALVADRSALVPPIRDLVTGPKVNNSVVCTIPVRVIDLIWPIPIDNCERCAMCSERLPLERADFIALAVSSECGPVGVLRIPTRRHVVTIPPK